VRGREGRGERGRERCGGRGSYPLVQEVGGGEDTSAGSTASAAPGSSFSSRRKTTGEKMGWASSGLWLGRKRRRDGLEMAQSKGSYLFFFQKSFLFSVFPKSFAIS
jgi:hypothetical protein